MPPYFSVVTPSFNQGGFISKCLESVRDQDDEDYEHLVFDNCSNDETAGVVKNFPRVVFRSEPDRGQSDAVNKGFLAAQGEIICWLNSDDVYPSGLFARLRDVFSDPTVDVVFGDVEQISYDGQPPLRAAAQFENRLDLIRWWSSRARLHQPAIFFRSQVREATGWLREDLHYAMDYEYWWRMSEQHRFHPVDAILAIQHRQPESKTITSWHKVYEERERIFAPYYHWIDGDDRSGLMQERGKSMAQRYLGEAFALSGHNRLAAIKLLGKSFKENPSGILSSSWLGVLRRCLN
jgi:glycosyltransferase involved in cell wall biosynthesis